ncbi:hypothetical protein ACFFRR_002748 [Megaselia abdita]
MIVRAVCFLLAFSLVKSLEYHEDPIKSFHMSDVEPMMAESVAFKDSNDTTTKEDNNQTIQPRSIPYSKAERRNYVHRARLEALRDDSSELDDILYPKVQHNRGRTASAYDSAEEDYSDDFADMQRAARRPFERIRNFFRPEPGLYVKSADPPTERPTIIKRFQSLFRQAPTKPPTPKPKPQLREPPKSKKDSKYQVLFWPITATNSDGVTSTNLVPHLVVRNPVRQEEILYAVPLVQLSQHEDYNIFHTADDQDVNSIKKIKSKQKRKQKRKNKNRPQQHKPAVNDDEVMMEHIIQSGSNMDAEMEDETTTSPPPPGPSFIFVGENAETAESFDDEDIKLRSSSLQQQQQYNRNRNYRRRYKNSYNNKHW